ncbi:hypothetical protein ACR78Z_24005 [Sphingobacterium thalpophilum]|uniref:hypothetical protein n=1 Tax=Sphingobacterium thalpophilum TaxID=259 RepID=UPI003DA5DBE3
MKKLLNDLFESAASWIVDYFPILSNINTAFSLSKHIIGIIRFIKNKNVLQPVFALFTKVINSLSYELNKYLKKRIQVTGSFNSDKITGRIMITGLAVLIPLSFIASFFTGLLHYIEHQNLISAVSIAMLYFGSISMFGFLQYKILKSTTTA